MSLAKTAQQHSEEPTFVIGHPTEAEEVFSVDDNDLDLDFDLAGGLEVSEEESEEPEESEDDNDLAGGQGRMVIQVGDEEPQQFQFTLPNVPGGASQDEIHEPAEIEVEDSEVEVEEPDMWDWGKRGGIGGFPSWLSGMMQGVPQHSGHDTVGLERVIAYLGAVDREISKAVRSDLKGELDIGMIEKARDELQRGCDRCTDRLDKLISQKRPKKTKNKKKADSEEEGLVKEAQKITGVHGVMVTVPLLISRIARVCINGMVSGGHDIEDLYKRQSELYKLNTREKAEVLQLLEDMGYAIRRDRGIHPDDEVVRGRSDNLDWGANYPA